MTTACKCGEPTDAPGAEASKCDDFAPFTLGEHFTPEYYRPMRCNPRISEQADVEDVVHAFGVDSPRLAEALRHLMRVGRKPGESKGRELTKVLEWVQREMDYDDEVL